MSADAVDRARIDTATKERAVEAPNKTTTRAMEDIEAGKGERFDEAEDLFEDLGI